MSDSKAALSAQNKEWNRISDNDLAALVDQAHPCILSMSRKEKGPIATPVWYEFRGGKFVFGIFPNSAKGKLITKNGHATITIQKPLEPYQYVMAEGTARARTNEELEAMGDTVWSTMRRIFGRYIKPDIADSYAAILPTLAPDYTIFELTPVSVRGETIPRHEDFMPRKKDVPEFIAAVEDGMSTEEAMMTFNPMVRAAQEEKGE